MSLRHTLSYTHRAIPLINVYDCKTVDQIWDSGRVTPLTLRTPQHKTQPTYQRSHNSSIVAAVLSTQLIQLTNHNCNVAWGTQQSSLASNSADICLYTVVHFPD